MDFRKIDESFLAWAKAKNLPVSTAYKDSEVRSVNIHSSSGKKWQLWLEPQSNSENCQIKYWDYESKAKTVASTNDELKEKLELVYSIVSGANE